MLRHPPRDTDARPNWEERGHVAGGIGKAMAAGRHCVAAPV